MNQKFIEALRHVEQEMPLLLESIEQQAKLIKAKYEALKREGFTKEEALELCKGKLMQF